MKFENTEVWGFEHAIRGMRNPKNSWNKSDSEFGCTIVGTYQCKDCQFKNFDFERVDIGENDMKLAQTLIKAGSEHRKFMRQIFVSVDITAPLYWWAEYDTYKVGTVANSTSKMHTITNNSITLDCFEIDDYEKDLFMYYEHSDVKDMVVDIVRNCETLRQRYLETKDKRYWKELIRWLPESWLQKRTVTMTYENLLAMCSKGQRRFHKLNEWSGQDNPNVPNFISWARTLPYAQELIFIDEVLDK